MCLEADRCSEDSLSEVDIRMMFFFTTLMTYSLQWPSLHRFYCYSHIDTEVPRQHSNIRRLKLNIMMFAVRILPIRDLALSTIMMTMSRRLGIEYVQDNRKGHTEDCVRNLAKVEIVLRSSSVVVVEH